jgi:hypothetical protein
MPSLLVNIDVPDLEQGVAFYAAAFGLVAPRRLENLVRCCAKPTGRKRRRAREAIASTLLGLIASALPNSFGDLGVFSVSEQFSRCTDYPRP